MDLAKYFTPIDLTTSLPIQGPIGVAVLLIKKSIAAYKKFLAALQNSIAVYKKSEAADVEIYSGLY